MFRDQRKKATWERPDPIGKCTGASLGVLVIGLLTALLWGGCAAYAPKPLTAESFQEQAVTQVIDGLRISATVLSAAETEELFGLPLYKKGIQPIWMEIENRTDERLWPQKVSVDRNYFAPLEVAYMHHSGYSKAARMEMDRFFHRHALNDFIASNTTHAGFIYTNLELGTKAFNLDVISEDRQVRTFTFLIPVEGLQVDHRAIDWTNLHASQKKNVFDRDQPFQEAIKALPCCTSDAKSARMADPINVVIIGKGIDVLYALLRSGWDETAAASSYQPTAQLPWEFRYQPVKPLYLFDRPQDAAFRKSRSTLNERNQLRLWLSPFVYHGKDVWVGQISRIIRRSVFDSFVIESDVDEARTYLLQDLWYAQALMQYGYIRKTDVATIAQPRKSLHDDEYFTDGLCLVLWISSGPTGFSKVRFLEWDIPVDDRRRLLLGR